MRFDVRQLRAQFDDAAGGMAFDARSNSLYAVDGHRINRIHDDGTRETVAGTGQAGKATDGAMHLRREPIPEIPLELKQIIEEMK